MAKVEGGEEPDQEARKTHFSSASALLTGSAQKEGGASDCPAAHLNQSPALLATECAHVFSTGYVLISLHAFGVTLFLKILYC